MLLSQLIDDLATLPITGVKRQFAAPPTQVNTADMPLAFPRVPKGEVSVNTIGGGVRPSAWTVELVCVIEAAGQSTQPANFEATVELIDAINAALEAYAAVGPVDHWAIKQDIEGIGDAGYWVIVASVEAS